MRVIAISLAISVSALISSQAFAKDVQISGKHNVSDIEMHCIDAGGSFFNGPGGGYGCATQTSTVTCTSKGKCTGTVPAQTGGTGKPVTTLPISGALTKSSAGPAGNPSGGNKGLTTTTPSALTNPNLLGGAGGAGGTTTSRIKSPTTSTGPTVPPTTGPTMPTR
jgi:hypothetical protein